MSWRRAGDLEEFPDGRGVEVRLGGRRIAVYRLGERLFALKNLCPHEGAELHRAAPREGAVDCPGHGWRFDLETGRCLRGDRDARVAVYPVRLEGREVWIDVG